MTADTDYRDQWHTFDYCLLLPRWSQARLQARIPRNRFRKCTRKARACDSTFRKCGSELRSTDEGPTGTTVFYFPDGVKGAVDIRGGAPGTVNATVLMDSYESKLLQAVVFSGGSWYGLSAATGVANGIRGCSNGTC